MNFAKKLHSALLTIIMLLFATTFSHGIDALPDVTGNIAGTLGGSFNVNETGSATYVVPVAVPPGIAGLTPTVSAFYNSANRDSTALGVGWSLAATSMISRCPTTLAHDGFIDGVDYDNNDRFCLDGKRLDLVEAGQYGTAGTKYYTENQSFDMITALGTQGNGVQSFEVRRKDGTISEYGSNSDSQIIGSDGNTVLGWFLSRTKDRFGNFIKYSYQTDTESAEHYLSTIEYAGNEGTGVSPVVEIRFIYESRNDIAPRYQSGVKFRIAQRLQKIQNWVEGTLAREYLFSYIYSNATARSMLSTIQDCAPGGVCLPLTQFDWQVGANKFEPPKQILTNEHFQGGDLQGRIIDTNGDGLDELFWKSKGTNSLAGCPAAENYPWKSWSSFISKGSSFDTTPQLLVPFGVVGPKAYSHDVYAYMWGGNQIQREYQADVNGDGKEDFIWWATNQPCYAAASGQQMTGYAVALNGWEPGQISFWNTNLLNNQNSDYKINFIDINGDARADYTFSIYTLSTDLKVHLSNGSDFGPMQTWLSQSSTTLSLSSSHLDGLVDVTGDGLPDKVWIPSGKDDIYVAINNGNGFHPASIWLSKPIAGNFAIYANGGGSYFVDMNGDGLNDYVWRPSGPLNEIKVAYSTGEKFELSETGAWLTGSMVLNHQVTSHYHAQEGFYDFNGDGRADYVWIPSDNGGLMYGVFSEGDKFSEPKILFQYSAGMPDGYGYLSSFGDLNGDGLIDRIWSPPYNVGGVHQMLSEGPATDYLTKIKNGYGAEIKISYKPITDKTVYSKGSGAIYPYQDTIGPLYVVAEYSELNDLGGYNATQYFYENLRTLVNGRGPCGFATITRTDVATGTTTITNFRQDHPFKSLPVSIERRQSSNGKTISFESLTWDYVTQGTGSYFVFVKERLSEEYELDGSMTKWVLSSFAYDSYGNVTTVTRTFNNGTVDIVDTTFKSDVPDWLLSKAVRKVTKTIVPGQSDLIRSLDYEYDQNTGALIKEIKESNNSTLKVVTDFEHDGFGNISKIVTSGPTFDTRSEIRFYGTSGRFLEKLTNGLGHQEFNTYDPRHGKVIKQTGPNGLTSTSLYDSFGRKIHESRPDGTESRWLYLQGGNVASSSIPQYFVRVDSTAQPTQITVYNALGHKISVQTVGFNGTPIHTEYRYDSLGRNIKESSPFFVGEQPQFMSFEYDLLGRNTKVTAQDGSINTTAYQGLTVIRTNPLGQTNTVTYDVRGLPIKSIDAKGHFVEMKYDGLGNLIEFKDPLGNLTTAEFDIVGRRIKVNEPNSGLREFEYDGLGNLIFEKDALNNIVHSKYDLLGRMLERKEEEGTTTWEFDLSEQGIGKLGRVVTENGFDERYSYDDRGRISSITTTLDGQEFVFNWTYDHNGRVHTLQYPTGFTIEHRYTSNSFLSEIVEPTSNKVIWVANTMNAKSQYSQITFGNGVVSNFDYESKLGFLEKIHSSSSVYGDIQKLVIEHNSLGVVKSRTDNLIGKREEFTYDDLNRLLTASVVNGYSVSMSYDAAGNIITKSDLGQYSYSALSPHAVTSISNGLSTIQYQYDANGNRISAIGSAGLDEHVEYSSYNQPLKIITPRSTVAFEYGPHHTLDSNSLYPRWKRVVSKGASLSPQKTYYVGSMFEREGGGKAKSSKNIHNIKAGNETVAVYTCAGLAINGGTYRYLHRDHLDSVEVITDDTGAVVERFSFDSWGRRRLPDWSLPTTPLNPKFDHGFTGHFHVDEAELIHMGGRIYDPISARFLSVDPIVQEFTSTQSSNRYSYVMNNPLTLRDPSGYGWFSKFFKNISKIAKSNVFRIATFVVAAYLAPWGSGSVITSLGQLSSAEGIAQFMGETLIAFVKEGMMVAAQGGRLDDVLQAGKMVVAGKILDVGHMAVSANFPDWAHTSPELNQNIKMTFEDRMKSQVLGMVGHGLLSGVKSDLSGMGFGVGLGQSLVGNSSLWARDAFIISQLTAIDKETFWKMRELMKPGSGGASVGPETKGLPFLIPGSDLPNLIGLRKDYFGAPNLKTILLGEGGVLSNSLNLIPGANSSAAFHDLFATHMTNNGTPYVLGNTATILPVIAANQAAAYWGNY